MELFSKRLSDSENIRISIRMVSDLAAGDAHYIQVFNILMRMSLGYLNLQLVGRNFFDAAAKVMTSWKKSSKAHNVYIVRLLMCWKQCKSIGDATG